MGYCLRLFVTLFSILIAVAAVFILFAAPHLEHLFPRAIGNKNCILVPELQACDKIVLHHPTGLLYLGCSTLYSRWHWTPAFGRLNATGRSEDDYVATYDAASSRIQRLRISGYASPGQSSLPGRGLSLHGMDVVPSLSDPRQLFVYLVNHREPLGGQDAQVVGADSCIEIFKTILGSDLLEYIQTVENPVILTPNDIVGSPDGKSFHFVNDHDTKLPRRYERHRRPYGSIGYCHVDEGCKIATSNLHAPNGITKSPYNNTFYVSDSITGSLSILDKQIDNSLVLLDVVNTASIYGRSIDKISVDRDGIVWAAAFVSWLTPNDHLVYPKIPQSFSSAIRYSLNTGPEVYFGKKYRVLLVFEDDGSIASGITTVAHDAQEGRLFLHGSSSTHLVVCKI